MGWTDSYSHQFIHDPELELAVEIDDRMLNLQEFGKMLTIYAGWGMRRTFIPEDGMRLSDLFDFNLRANPIKIVKEPRCPARPTF